MKHYMKLREDPFRRIVEGKKNIEYRLYDDKRKKVCVGDYIEFTNMNTGEVVNVEVLELYLADTFDKLRDDLVYRGFIGSNDFIPQNMEKYYTKEEQAQYGVVGFLIRVKASAKSYNIKRFLDAQENCYDSALKEIQSGHKRGHWIWFIFPQLSGLGNSYNSKYYGISDAREAQAYLENDTLRQRLLDISEALYKLNTNDILSVMWEIDAYKVRSCMTLFYLIAPQYDIFKKVLDKYFMSKMCEITENIIKRQK